MRSGYRKNILVLQLALLLVSLAVISGCWIPLPEETAIIVDVFDTRGNPVDGVILILDGTTLPIVTGSQRAAGQVFVKIEQEGDHTLQLDTATLVDPQGGIGSVPLAYQISSFPALAFTNKPFVGNSDVLTVPVNKGETTRVTFYLDDILKSPLDNQWLTDGLDAGNPYRTVDADEFTNSPRPTFWWRQDPSLEGTVNFTFQLWEDDDGDTRFPLGVMNVADYSAFSKTPDWEESNQAMFNSVAYSSGSTTWPLGWTYAYAGSLLGTSAASGEGEYVWRVIQEGSSGVPVPSKLGAFYTYSGYYYASTESFGIPWGTPVVGPSTPVGHREVLSYVEVNINSADVIGAPFDSTSADTRRFQQRTASQFSSQLAAGASSTSQLTILYNTDEDGQATIALEEFGGFFGIMKVLAVNKQRPLPTLEPHLQTKEFQLSYFDTDDEVVTWPAPFTGSGESIYFVPPLDDADFEDPLW